MEEKPEPIGGQPTEAVDIGDGVTMAREKPYEGRYRPRRPRYYGGPGLLGFVPDTLIPPESKRHLHNARRETMLAARSLIQALVHGVEDRSRMTRRRSRRSIREMMDETED